MRTLWHSICNLCQVIFTNSEIIDHLQRRLDSDPANDRLLDELDTYKKARDEAAGKFKTLAIEYNLRNGRDEYEPIIIRDTMYCFCEKSVQYHKI